MLCLSRECEITLLLSQIHTVIQYQKVRRDVWEGGSCTVAYARINASDTYGEQEEGDRDEHDTDEQDEMLRAQLREKKTKKEKENSFFFFARS